MGLNWCAGWGVLDAAYMRLRLCAGVAAGEALTGHPLVAAALEGLQGTSDTFHAAVDAVSIHPRTCTHACMAERKAGGSMLSFSTGTV